MNVASGNLVVRARDLADSTRTGHVVVDRFYVCFNGKTSGARCGEIKRVNTTFNRHKNLVRVAVCSNPGDSGAPFFKGGRAFGILSGHRTGIFGKCSGAYYTGARIAEDSST